MQKSKQISNLTYEEIKILIEAVNNIKYIIKNEFNKYDSIVSKKVIGDLTSLLISFMWIYILSIIIFPHAEYTRYPRIRNNEGLSPSDYTEKLGIVRATLLLIPHLENSSLTLKKYINLSN
jgi:hypothetical protein